MEKIYIVVRADLPCGAQVAQACHAAFQFTLEHLELTLRWERESNNLVVLSVPNEEDLERLTTREGPPARMTYVREPDLNNALTALAFGPEAAKYLSSLPLALRLPKAA
jgi:hypothetical protein